MFDSLKLGRNLMIAGSLNLISAWPFTFKQVLTHTHGFPFPPFQPAPTPRKLGIMIRQQHSDTWPHPCFPDFIFWLLTLQSSTTLMRVTRACMQALIVGIASSSGLPNSLTFGVKAIPATNRCHLTHFWYKVGFVERSSSCRNMSHCRHCVLFAFCNEMP